MTDFDRVKELLLHLGVGGSYYETKNALGTAFKIIRCREGEEKVTGYPEFYMEYVFDKNGAFIEINIGED
jgi:hypothetical protein